MEQNVILGAVILGGLTVFGYTRMLVSERRAKRLKEVLPKAMIVDVRSASEFKSGHYPGAVNIPVDRLAKGAGRLGNKASPKVVYCESGARARQAARIMRAMGFSSVHIGGTRAQLEKLAE